MCGMNDDLRRRTAGSLVEICHRLSRNGLAIATDGNVSVRLPDGSILATPRGVSKGLLSADELVEIRPDGTPASATPRVTTEIRMHLEVYSRRPDVRAVCHAHPPFATSFAVAGIPIDQPFLPEVLVSLGSIPLAPYATPSTDEVPASIRALIGRHDALLLANHGVLTCGSDLNDAYFKMEKVEHAASVLYRAITLGGPRLLTKDQVERLNAVHGYRESGPGEKH